MKELISDFSTSITEINKCLIVQLTGEMTDCNIRSISESVAERAYKSGISGAVLNFAAVNVMDSYTFNAFMGITRSLSILGVAVVWVGLSPGVVCALIDLNVDFDGKKMLTALNLEQGLELLAKQMNNKDRKLK